MQTGRAICFVLLPWVLATEVWAQGLPPEARAELTRAGATRTVGRLEKLLSPLSAPKPDQVADLLATWEEEAGGPRGGWQWLAVAGAWQRVGAADSAAVALGRVSVEVPRGLVLLTLLAIGVLSVGAQMLMTFPLMFDIGSRISYGCQ
jgi:hypothetical protein